MFVGVFQITTTTPFLAGGIYKLMKGAENNTVGSQLGKPNTRKKGPLVSYWYYRVATKQKLLVIFLVDIRCSICSVANILWFNLVVQQVWCHHGNDSVYCTCTTNAKKMVHNWLGELFFRQNEVTKQQRPERSLDDRIIRVLLRMARWQWRCSCLPLFDIMKNHWSKQTIKLVISFWKNHES